MSALNSINSSEIEIILSTSHRHRFTITKWKEIFKNRGISFNKISRVRTNISTFQSRKSEIENWIHIKKLKPEEIIIIDDDKSLNGLSSDYKKRLILTNSYTGLKDATEINNVLSIKRRT
ncbi:hypothetical protein BWK59_04880 [Flavobacterium davisii]|uniref:FCP1 homology domain-containing protein n=1 Tax=Flavobacterium davisii TaxID=2906077 RepID=A0A246GJQ1_9FLAO|nr:hypothetical protein BWK59_04880 [Flavobacterium davisii]